MNKVFGVSRRRTFCPDSSPIHLVCAEHASRSSSLSKTTAGARAPQFYQGFDESALFAPLALKMRHSRWTAPPTRREFTLLLCAFTIFIISYNLNPSLHVIGLTPGASLQKLGLGSDPGFDADGRRPESFRDDSEDLIFGNWEWVEGQVAGLPAKTQKERATAQRQKSFHYVPPSVNSQQVDWAKKHPNSVLVKHTPGWQFLRTDSLNYTEASLCSPQDTVLSIH